MPRYQAGYDDSFSEIERDGCIVRTARGRGEKSRRKEETLPDEDTARWVYAKHVTRARMRGMTLAGRSQVLESKEAPEPVASGLLVDEYFAQADDRFLGEILRMRDGGKLAAFAERWHTDKRPWARRMLLAYILDGCDLPHHKGLVKRLYKRTEAAGDDEAVAHFMVAFDSFRKRLFVTKDVEYGDQDLVSNPERPQRHFDGVPESRRFSLSTQLYLVRRAYRYFRRMAFGDPTRYVRGILVALPLYRDENLLTPAQLLDSWGLLQSLYGESKALSRDPRGMRLEHDKGLVDLSPAPRWPMMWKIAELFEPMIQVLLSAQSRTVRGWLARWLRLHHGKRLAQLPFAQVKPLLLSSHDEVAILGGELFAKLTGLETLSITDWLDLLAIENVDVVGVIAGVVEKHVSPNRLTLEQCIVLACAKTAPVARLGLSWARAKKIEREADLIVIARIARAGVASVRAEGTEWAASIIKSHPAATSDHLRDLCDAPHEDAREKALAVVEETPKLATPSLWFALTESPYPDVRDVVIDNAKKWRDEAPPATLRHVYSSAMLSVHRGARAKQRVPKQIAERIVTHPAEAEQLLPILRVALRSVRPPERAAALSGLVRALRENEELRTLAARLIPELTLGKLVTQ